MSARRFRVRIGLVLEYDVDADDVAEATGVALEACRLVELDEAPYAGPDVINVVEVPA